MKVAESNYIIIYPGLGHTGSTPFDDTHGWYRSFRALAGSVSYTAECKGWSPFEHHIFPYVLKQSVLTLLLCQNANSLFLTNDNNNNNNNNSSSSYAIVSNRLIMNNNRKNKNNNYDRNFPPSKKNILNNYADDSCFNAKANYENCDNNDNVLAVMNKKKDSMCIKSSLNITNLPVFVIYYIMEFMVSQVMITTVSFYLHFYIFIYLYSYIFIYLYSYIFINLYSYIFIYLYSYVLIHHLYMLKKCVVILLLVLLCTHFYDNVKSQNTSYTNFFYHTFSFF